MNLEAKIADRLGESVLELSSLAGGCISEAFVVHLKNGQKAFVKTANVSPDMFFKESNGLKELLKAKAIRVPNVLHVDEEMLILEYIEQGQKDSNFFPRFGPLFAKLHRYYGKEFGFFEDNYIGSMVQKNMHVPAKKNANPTDWPGFYFENRLLYQVKLAENNGLATNELRNIINKIESKIDVILKGSEEPPTLLHGDLWSGNFLVGKDSEPWLIDPAVYYGHREADLAMTKLFGGFPQEFYQAYQKAHPLAEGYEFRESIYKSYHLLNHLNLFGNSYYDQSVRSLKQYL